MPLSNPDSPQRCTPPAGRVCDRPARVEFVLERFAVKRVYRCAEHAADLRKALATSLACYRSAERRLPSLTLAEECV